MRVLTTKIRQYNTGGLYAKQGKWENPRVVLHLVQRTYHEGGTAIFSARLAWTLHNFLPNEVNNRANVYSINTIPLYMKILPITTYS